MNIDTQTLQEDTTPQQLPLLQRRLSTTHYTTTCVAQDIVQPLTLIATQQLPEQHHEPSTISTPFSSLLTANPPLTSSDAYNIVPTTIRTTTVSATHVVDIPPSLTPPVDVVHTATQTDPSPSVSITNGMSRHGYRRIRNDAGVLFYTGKSGMFSRINHLLSKHGVGIGQQQQLNISFAQSR